MRPARNTCVIGGRGPGGRRPKGSRVEGEREFSTPGLYTCPDGELTPFSYATRSRIVMDQSERNATNCDVGWTPLTQFIFRGDETGEGAATNKVKSCGADHQHIYLKVERVIWKELQVWIGVPMFEASEEA